jgi:hypothetical protein
VMIGNLVNVACTCPRGASLSSSMLVMHIIPSPPLGKKNGIALGLRSVVATNPQKVAVVVRTWES